MAADPSKRLIAPCVVACPAEIDVPRYIGYVERGQFAEAEAVVRESIPLPVACGLICYRPCEPWCRRGIMEEPVAINAIKRAATEYGARDERPDAPIAEPTGKRVAIVGGGPTGLTAAYYLARRKGHHVALFDAMPQLGGQLRIGLPEYKAPRDLLDREIDLVTQVRVDVRTGMRIDSLDELPKGYDAVLLAVGQMRPTPLGVPGEDLPGVETATIFLRDLNLGRPVEVGSRVVVLGGDNVAVDSARCTVRLGARDVRVVMPYPLDEAPAYDFEIAAAQDEGVEFLQQLRVVGIARDEGALALDLERLEVAGADELGRATLEPAVEGHTVLEADTILVSAGRAPELPEAWGLPVTPRDVIGVDRSNLMTPQRGVFAAGDIVTGPDSIVEAMAQGKKAAQSIDRFLGGDGDISETFAPPPGQEMVMPAHLAEQGKPAVPVPLASKWSRTHGFAIVEQGYGVSEAQAEARRCIRCDLWRDQVPEVWSEQEG